MPVTGDQWRPRHLQYAVAGDLTALRAALDGPADGVLVDLEDGVVADMKDVARQHCVTVLGRPGWAVKALVRINDRSSRWARPDIEAVAGLAHQVLLPKVEEADDIRALDELLTAAERRAGRPTGSVGMFAILETPRAVLDAVSIAASSPRIRGLVVGQADLTLGLGCRGIGEDGFETSPVLEWAHAQVVFAAAARGLPCYVAPWVRSGDPGSEREMRRLLQLGYAGIVVYDLDGVRAAQRARRPTDRQVEFARAALAARDAAAANGSGHTSYRGWTIEGSYAEIARAVLQAADVAAIETAAADAAAAAAAAAPAIATADVSRDR